MHSRAPPHFLDGHRHPCLYRASTITPNLRRVNPEFMAQKIAP
jgi:hypothetical protein